MGKGIKQPSTIVIIVVSAVTAVLANLLLDWLVR